MIGIRLDKNIACENICKLIQNLVNNYVKENGSLTNALLNINIVQFSDGTIQDQILNIEHH
jgi:hypothetical protein